MSARVASLPALLLAIALPAQSPTVTTVINNGTTDTRYDIVILGDGYQANEQPQFDQDANTFLTGLFQKEPYATFAAYYNVHTVFRASQDSGADRPDENPPVFVTTAYEATYNYGGTDRCLYIQNTSQALADAALAPATEGRVLVIVNDDRYGGCAGTFAVSYNGTSLVEVQAHELGHSLGLLADEYDYPYGTYSGGEPSSPNVTAQPTGNKWSLWHGTDGISAFEGAGYYQYGLYRPRSNCLMRALGQPLCRVCQENITLVTNSIVDVIPATTPPTTAPVAISVPALQPFSFSHYVPAGNNPTIEWRVDGALQSSTTTSFTLDSTQWPLGSHTVTATLTDHSDRVRSDPNALMVETRTWQVSIANPNAAQLRIPGFSTSLVIASPGDALTATATLVNAGPAAAGAFDLELFLSTSGTGYTLQDPMLARVAVPGLAVGQSLPLTIPLHLPFDMPLSLQTIHAVVDRTDAVLEADENDNTSPRPLFAVAGPCATGLEFHDQLVPPRTGAISVAAGGTLHPTVVATCSPATLSLIAWTASGTTPGITLSPGLTLPLNPDAYTDLGLAGLNGPVFGQFFGALDAQGLAQATFTLPPNLATPPGATHLAAVLLGDPLFQAVSNPIELTLKP